MKIKKIAHILFGLCGAFLLTELLLQYMVAPRTGAWIETNIQPTNMDVLIVILAVLEFHNTEGYKL